MIRSLVVGSNKRTSLLANDKQAIGELVMQVNTLAESIEMIQFSQWWEAKGDTRMRTLFATILLLVFVLAIQGYAQSITGSLNGRVVDQQGSAVPDAKVTAIEPTKKVTVTTNTTGVGDFSIAGLAPGIYTVTVEANGFKKITRPDVTLNASDKIALGDMA